jgi:hypothetical protein
MIEPSLPPPRRGLIGPFTGRQLLSVVAVIVVAGVGLTLATRPIAPGPGGATAIPVSTPFLVARRGRGCDPATRPSCRSRGRTARSSS